METLTSRSRVELNASDDDRPLRSVVILDDEGIGRRDLEHGFRQLGATTFVTHDADDAEAWARRHGPDLLIMELGPVGAPRLALLATLRHELPASRFVVTTSYGSVATAVRAMKLGATHYLCKPVTAAFVLEVLRDVSSVAALDPAPEIASVMTLDQAIWEYLHQTVEMAGSITEAARRLGIWRQSLRRMLAKYRPSDPIDALRSAGPRPSRSAVTLPKLRPRATTA